jgi:hypothetical protein
MRDRACIDILEARVAALDGWLETNGAALDGQYQLDRTTVECAYWHAGYRQALGDVMRPMAAGPPASTEDTASPSRPADPDAGRCQAA